MINKIVFSIFLILIVSGRPQTGLADSRDPSNLAQVDYGTGAGKKLGRGLANIAFGWVDILKGIQAVADEDNLLAAMTWGPIYGTGQAVVRTLAGAYEVITFPIAIPNNFEPLLQPEFVLEQRV